MKTLLEETEPSDHDTDLEDSQSQGNKTVWRKSRRKRGKTDEEETAAPLVSAGQPTMCHLLAPPLERSGRETPVSVDSIPLEWDHTVDVGGSSSHEDDEDDATFFSTLSGRNDGVAKYYFMQYCIEILDVLVEKRFFSVLSEVR